MSLEKMVDDKVDAYRNNPGALQKNYQMNQDLLDLLALQKIKSEKDTAARQLQMSMQQDSKTIAEQRGDEAVNRSKDEVVEQVGGVAKVNQARQQSNMQRAAAGAGQMTGVAGQPAPNMRMQSGGIVSFAQGDPVLSDDQLKRLGITRQDYDEMTSDEKAEQAEYARIAGLVGNVPTGGRAPGLRRRGMGPGGRQTFASQRRVDTSTAPPTDAERLAEQRQDAFKRITGYGTSPAGGTVMGRQTFANQPLRGVPAAAAAGVPTGNISDIELGMIDDQGAIAGGPRTVDNSAGAYGFPRAGMPGVQDLSGVAGARGFDPVTYNKISTEGIGPGARVAYKGQAVTPERIADINAKQDYQQNFNLTEMARDSGAERLAQQTQADEFQNRSGIAKIRAEQLAQQRLISENNRRDAEGRQFYDLLSRAGGQGALANIGRAKSDMERARRLQVQQDFDRTLNIQDKGIKDDLDISGRSLRSGDKTYELSEVARRTAATNNQSMINNLRTNLTKDAIGFLDADKANLTEDARVRRDLVGILTANASNELKADIANMQGKLEADSNSIKSMIGKAKSKTAFIEIVEKIDGNIAKINTQYDKDLQSLIAKDLELSKLKTDNEDGKNDAKIKAKIKELSDRTRALADANLEDYRALRVYALKGLVGAGGSASGMSVVGQRAAP